MRKVPIDLRGSAANFMVVVANLAILFACVARASSSTHACKFNLVNKRGLPARLKLSSTHTIEKVELATLDQCFVACVGSVVLLFFYGGCRDQLIFPGVYPSPPNWSLRLSSELPTVERLKSR